MLRAKGRIMGGKSRGEERTWMIEAEGGTGEVFEKFSATMGSVREVDT